MNDDFFRHIPERFYRQNVNFNNTLKLYISQSPHVDIATQPKTSKHKKRIGISYYMEVDSVNGQKQLILNGGGIALLPQWAIEQELNTGKLVQLLPEFTFSSCISAINSSGK